MLQTEEYFSSLVIQTTILALYITATWDTILRAPVFPIY